jgi:hypothetical protein
MRRTRYGCIQGIPTRCLAERTGFPRQSVWVNSDARPRAQVLVHAASPRYIRLPVDGRAAWRFDLARFPNYIDVRADCARFRGALPGVVGLKVRVPVAKACQSLRCLCSIQTVIPGSRPADSPCGSRRKRSVLRS